LTTRPELPTNCWSPSVIEDLPVDQPEFAAKLGAMKIAFRVMFSLAHRSTTAPTIAATSSAVLAISHLPAERVPRRRIAQQCTFMHQDAIALVVVE
jgi:hypothetical protein